MFCHVELDERWALTAAVFPGASEVSQKVFISIDVMLEWLAYFNHDD